MVNKKYLVISYLCAFLLVYFCAIAYALIPPILEKGFNKDVVLPQSEATNTAISAVAEIDISTLILMLLALIIIILLLTTMSSFFMFGAH